MIRHACASSVDVELAAGDELVLVVEDQGLGPAADRGGAPGFGLRNMAARAASLGGSFEIRRRNPRGTIAEWRIPLAAATKGT